MFEQLKQRNVVRVAVLYLVVCWLILDPVHVVFHMLDVPIWADRLVVILMALGFPAALIFAWVYEVTPEGLKPSADVPDGQSIRKLTGRRLDRAIIAVMGVALAYFAIDKFWISRHLAAAEPAPTVTSQGSAPAVAAPTTAAAPPASVASFNPPAHSIAVLPFLNMSGDPAQEYFSDGLTEELLNSLTRINELQVAARTSSFSFKGKDADISTVAHKLNVSAVLEGSVRRSGHTVRVTAQLINAVSGFHLWSQTYDRDLGDVLRLQTEIANAVASALKVTLLSDIAAKVELGGTRNPEAFDAYLRGLRTTRTGSAAGDYQAASDDFSKAIRLDPDYALAFAMRSIARTAHTQELESGSAMREGFNQALADAQKAIALAPQLGEGHAALAEVFEFGFLDFSRASQEYERAEALAPGSATVLIYSSMFSAYMNRPDAALAAARRLVTLDPLNLRSHRVLGGVLQVARRDSEAIAAFDESIALQPSAVAYALRGQSYYALGDLENARTSCEGQPDLWEIRLCLALTYDKLGRHADAAAMLAKMQSTLGNASAYQYAQIYAQWGNPARALEWLGTAVSLRDSGLVVLKTDRLLDPLRHEARFQAIESALRFP
jgi:TolB-like protein